MKITKVTEPWTHYIIDDFLSEDDFKYVQKVTKSWPKAPTQFEKLNLRLDDFKFYEETFVHYQQSKRVRAILTQGAKNLETYFELEGKYKSVHYEYVNCGEEFWYRIHKDATEKIMSHVLYVSEEGDGTRLFSNLKKENETQVEWKPNRMISFFNGSSKYHDYYSTYKDRVSFNICFLSKKINHKRPLRRFEDNLTLRDF